MPAALLQLEVTESMVMQNVARAVKILTAIQHRWHPAFEASQRPAG
jgi:hypothetical protein